MATKTKNTKAENKLVSAIVECISPEAVALLVSLTRVAGSYRNGEPGNESAINEVNWLADELMNVIGVRGFNTLIEEIGL